MRVNKQSSNGAIEIRSKLKISQQEEENGALRAKTWFKANVWISWVWILVKALLKSHFASNCFFYSLPLLWIPHHCLGMCFDEKPTVLFYLTSGLLSSLKLFNVSPLSRVIDRLYWDCDCSIMPRTIIIWKNLSYL